MDFVRDEIFCQNKNFFCKKVQAFWLQLSELQKIGLFKAEFLFGFDFNFFALTSLVIGPLFSPRQILI